MEIARITEELAINGVFFATISHQVNEFKNGIALL